jgi:hypothetical protein
MSLALIFPNARTYPEEGGQIGKPGGTKYPELSEHETDVLTCTSRRSNVSCLLIWLRPWQHVKIKQSNQNNISRWTAWPYIPENKSLLNLRCLYSCLMIPDILGWTHLSEIYDIHTKLAVNLIKPFITSLQYIIFYLIKCSDKLQHSTHLSINLNLAIALMVWFRWDKSTHINWGPCGVAQVQVWPYWEIM